MRIVMISWEFPPKIIGGISRHVYDLSIALTKQGHEVHVLTAEHPNTPAEEIVEGVHVYRVSVEGPTNDFIHWVHRLNDAIYARGEKLIEQLIGAEKPIKQAKQPKIAKPGTGSKAVAKLSKNGDKSQLAKDWSGRDPIVIHAHDWLAYFAARGLKYKYHLPMVATIHATEYGRNNGISGPTQSYISSIEWELVTEAWRVVVCSEYMKRECEHALKAPWDKMDVIYNGVDPKKFEINSSPEELASFRARFAAPEEKIVFFVGRLVREKGVQVLIEALPKIRWGYHDTKLLICGGGYRDHLVSIAHYVGMERHVYFAGFVPDDELLKIFHVGDIACFPSLYEPFGIVALEAMAAKRPVVVSDAGGLPEVVRDQVTGTTTYAGNPNSLADGILSILHQPERAQAMAEAAYREVLTTFNWYRIAGQTLETYNRVWAEHSSHEW